MDLPVELYYTEEHEWLRREGGTVRIGITDFAQSELGDIVFVELPEVGAMLKANEPFGSVESVKTVSELYAPVTGKVVEVNSSLEDAPEKVNEEAYGEGWMITVEMADVSELEGLLSAQAYGAQIGKP